MRCRLLSVAVLLLSAVAFAAEPSRAWWAFEPIARPKVPERANPVDYFVRSKLGDKGFVVLAINELEDEAKVREHITTYKHTFPVLMDRDNRVANQFGVYGLPVSVFIDQEGRVQEYIKGGLLTEQKIDETVSRILNQKPVKSASAR